MPSSKRQLTRTLNGKNTAGCFHFVQHFSLLYFSAYVSVSCSWSFIVSSFTEDMERLLKSLPIDYKNALLSGSDFEADFKNEDKYWYSPFILWSKDEVENYQPDYDSELSSFLAIGSNGGGETYLLNITDGSVSVCDLIAGKDSLEYVALNYTELLGLLNN